MERQTGTMGKILGSLPAFIRYNASHVFAGKFVYFLALAVALFLFISIIHVLNENSPPGASTIYFFLFTPGVLLLLYPSAYSIQSDIDARMIETLFGIPDYRYKVWLVRYLTQYLVIAALLTGLGLFCRFAMADFPLGTMIYHLMFPIVFLSSVGFMVSTLTRSGNGTAVVMVIVILFFWIAHEPLEGSRWDLFHNPFAQVDAFEVFAWEETTLYNRIYLIVGAALATMFALLRLQKREKFV